MLFFLLKILLLASSLIVGSTAFVVFLYRSIHFIEEHPTKSKERITLLIYSISLLHVFLLIRGFSLLNMVFSLLCQYMFYSLLPEYPSIETGGPGFIAALFMAFFNHFWYLNTMISRRMGAVEILIYFFVCVWATPFAFLLSLTANDDVILGIGEKKAVRRTFAGKIIDKLLYGERKEPRRYEPAH